VRRGLLYAASIATVLLLWQVRAMRVDTPVLFPYPRDVAVTLFELLAQTATYRIILHSLFRLAVSIAIAFFSGVLIGQLAGYFRPLAHYLTPVVAGLRSLPVASLIVIILILYGRAASIYIIAFLVVFPLIYESTRQGVLNIDAGIIQALKLENVSWIDKLVKIHLPLSYPHIKTGLLQSFGLGFKVLVMAEFIAQAETSIGRMLYVGRVNMEYDHVFAWTIIIIFLVVLMELTLSKLRRST